MVPPWVALAVLASLSFLVIPACVITYAWSLESALALSVTVILPLPDTVVTLSSSLAIALAPASLTISTVVVEGVETKVQVEFLRDIGSYYAQGYYFSKPVEIEVYESMLKENREM